MNTLSCFRDSQLATRATFAVGLLQEANRSPQLAHSWENVRADLSLLQGFLAGHAPYNGHLISLLKGTPVSEAERKPFLVSLARATLALPDFVLPDIRRLNRSDLSTQEAQNSALGVYRSPPQPRIQVVDSNFNPVGSPIEVSAKAEVNLGRRDGGVEDIDIFFDSKRVSSHHAKIVKRGTDTYELYDVGSSNGTRVLFGSPPIKEHLNCATGGLVLVHGALITLAGAKGVNFLWQMPGVGLDSESVAPWAWKSKMMKDNPPSVEYFARVLEQPLREALEKNRDVGSIMVYFNDSGWDVSVAQKRTAFTHVHSNIIFDVSCEDGKVYVQSQEISYRQALSKVPAIFDHVGGVVQEKELSDIKRSDLIFQSRMAQALVVLLERKMTHLSSVPLRTGFGFPSDAQS